MLKALSWLYPGLNAWKVPCDAAWLWKKLAVTRITHNSTHDGISFTTNCFLCAHLSPLPCCLMEASYPGKCSLPAPFECLPSYQMEEEPRRAPCQEKSRGAKCHDCTTTLGFTLHVRQGNPHTSSSVWLNNGSSFTAEWYDVLSHWRAHGVKQHYCWHVNSGK